LLEALVACAGVTLNAVATAIGVVVRSGVVRAEAISIFAVRSESSRTFPSVFSASVLPSTSRPMRPKMSWPTLVRLTERYCVVYQSLRQPPAMTVTRQVSGVPQRAR
jgi:hypothetical protein